MVVVVVHGDAQRRAVGAGLPAGPMSSWPETPTLSAETHAVGARRSHSRAVSLDVELIAHVSRCRGRRRAAYAPPSAMSTAGHSRSSALSGRAVTVVSGRRRGVACAGELGSRRDLRARIDAGHDRPSLGSEPASDVLHAERRLAAASAVAPGIAVAADREEFLEFQHAASIFLRARPSWRSGRDHGSCSKASLKPASGAGTPMPSSGVWKMTKVAVCAVFHLLEELVLDHGLGDAAVRQAAHEIHAADVLAVDLQAEAGRQQARRAAR